MFKLKENKITAGLRHSLRVALFGVFLFLLWPAMWGGMFQITVVSGTSMLPTFKDGDIVLSMRQDDYEINDIVVYPPPGIDCFRCNVIHRIKEINSKDEFKTQGDNNEGPDGWFVPKSEAYGKIIGHVHLPAWTMFIKSIYFWTFAFALSGILFSYFWYRETIAIKEKESPHENEEDKE